ncbi:uncharacterized protein YbjT (DUF2867 family) [Rhodopirellula rubra]|uniref:Uncharacterized protein YbjT (DUF2867 family) n=1 Tax=Aporhodopirellula rubra TaxID=980271 RepID=A0A7W5DWL1_9BACT|nr:SDR family oxidoreductase [Aporhodopirellula rubra]MBB3205889.1 uncharacterized protein YbjT (DUF2867 family) [Aporhodopirellula rubra]
MQEQESSRHQTKVLVVGATGYLGKYMIRELKQRGYWVRALARSRAKLDAVADCVDEIFVGEATRAETLEGVCDEIDIVFSSLGITRQRDGLTYTDVDYQANKNVLDIAIQSGVEKFLYVSALNADKLPNIQILAAKKRFVSELQASPIKSIVVRPNGFYSDMKEVLKMARQGRVYVFGTGECRSNPIHGADLARFCIDQFSTENTACDVGGPEILTTNEIARLAFTAVGKEPRITRVPLWIKSLVLFFARTLTSVKIYGPIEFFLTVLTMDMVAPTTGSHTLGEFFEREAKKTT